MNQSCSPDPTTNSKTMSPNFQEILDRFYVLHFWLVYLFALFSAQSNTKFIKEIGKKIKEKIGNKNATSHIIQAISMTVQRGNATSIMGTLGPLRKFEDFFDVISPREEES